LGSLSEAEINTWYERYGNKERNIQKFPFNRTIDGGWDRSDIIQVIMPKSPKRSKSAEFFDLYQQCHTVQDYFDICAAVDAKRSAKSDIYNDVNKGLIKLIPAAAQAQAITS
jgi:hypothetical protein